MRNCFTAQYQFEDMPKQCLYVQVAHWRRNVWNNKTKMLQLTENVYVVKS